MQAALPMYRVPPAALQAFWSTLAGLLRHAGVPADRVPAHLHEADDCHVQWLEPDLLLSQACGYPLVTQLAGRVQLLGTFAYDAPGVDGIQCRSQLVCRAADTRQQLADFAGSTLAFNDTISQSGYNALRALVANSSSRRPFFGARLQTGAHLRAIAAVLEGRADMAAIDAVTLALWQQDAPEAPALRVFGQTAPYPGLPLITALHTPPETLAALRAALQQIATDPAHAGVRAPLRITGFAATTLSDYRVCTEMQEEALARGLTAL